MFSTVNRDNTNAIKWELYRDKGLLPMWVADSDIATPEAIVSALKARVDHPIFGYTHPWPSLNKSVVDWCQSQYQWSIEPEWIVWMPGVVPSFNLAIDLFAGGGKVLVQTPNYPPMLNSAERNGAQTVTIEVTWNGESWSWDWQALEAQLADPDCHLFLLCNPMNPNGSVLSRADLERVANLCKANKVFLCSDEIHCDIILDDVKHTPASSIDTIADQSVTLMAASKTFNVAGLGCSFAIIPDKSVRQKWQQRMAERIPYPNFMGMIAAETAFTQCHDWHSHMLAHFRTNRQLLEDGINALPGMVYRPQPATFLAWIESTQEDTPLDKIFIDAGIMPSEGKYFGMPNNVRLNFATGTETVELALNMLKKSLL